MTDANTSTMSDDAGHQLGHAHDELCRAQALLNAASIIVDLMYSRDLGKAENNTLDSIGTCLDAADDIIGAVRRDLDTVLDGTKARAAA